ncbi:MAG TPA: DUF421 domain-containing protein [Candidatus Yaniella excrementigallinarum]|nr:DUF421 domain-containing protein [Candidatus Yaniella excrementigallinarum]
MDIILRAAIMFLLLWTMVRASGRSTLGELSSFDLVVFIVMGNLVQQGITLDDRSLTGGLLAIGTMMALSVGLSYAKARWPRFGKTLQGRPVILIRDGVVDRKTMQHERIGLDTLSMMARQAGIEDFDVIRLAILEANGKISFFTTEARPQA